METQLKIYTNRLQDGEEDVVDCTLDPEIVGVDEEMLRFRAPISVKGKAYLAGDECVVVMELATSVTVPCAVCDAPVEEPLLLKDVYIAEPLSTFVNGIFDVTALIREQLLLDAPTRVECNGGACPNRAVLEKYLKTDATSGDGCEEKGYHPFADI